MRFIIETYNLKSKLLFSIFLFLFIIHSCEQTPDVKHPEINVDGIYESELINLKFPEYVNDFKRVSIRKYLDNLNDISVGYRLLSNDKDITATFYMTWTGLFELPFQDTLNVIYKMISHEIMSSSNYAGLLNEEEVIFCDTIKGKRGLFSFKFPDDDRRMISELRLFIIDEVILKYRITYPIIQKELVIADINDLISKIEKSYLQ